MAEIYLRDTGNFAVDFWIFAGCEEFSAQNLKINCKVRVAGDGEIKSKDKSERKDESREENKRE